MTDTHHPADAWLASLAVPVTEGERALVRQTWRAAAEWAAGIVGEWDKGDEDGEFVWPWFGYWVGGSWTDGDRYIPDADAIAAYIREHG